MESCTGRPTRTLFLLAAATDRANQGWDECEYGIVCGRDDLLHAMMGDMS